MESPQATFDRTLAFIHRLAQAQLASWLSGGWAEELHTVCAPRLHRDIDLFYPAATFATLDHWLAGEADLQIIAAKQFSHKRAVLCEQVMVEFLLLQPHKAGYQTNFFDGAVQLDWPANTLSELVVEGRVVPVASTQALQLYRQHHHRIAEAYQAYVQTHGLV